MNLRIKADEVELEKRPVHPRLLVNTVDGGHIVVRELNQLRYICRQQDRGERQVPTHSYVLLHPLWILALRNDNCTALYSPAERNLSRSGIMGSCDPDHVRILKEDGFSVVLLGTTYNMTFSRFLRITPIQHHAPSGE